MCSAAPASKTFHEKREDNEADEYSPVRFAILC